MIIQMRRNKMKEFIEETLLKTGRPAIEPLLDYLEDSDFYNAPASTKYHNSYPGGLAKHSISVYRELSHLNEYLDLNINKDSIIICGLLHDLCKIGVYKIDEEDATNAQVKYLTSLIRKGDGVVPEGELTKQFASDLIGWYKGGMQGEKPTAGKTYVYDDDFPFGHGEKSVVIAQRFIFLEDNELLAIRYHMGMYGNHDDRNYHKAKDMYPLVEMLHLADRLATLKENIYPEEA